MESLSSILEQTEHRPYPLPHRPWVMVQTWRDLLFAHWRVDVGYLRGLVPRQLELDVYDGSCWVAVTPFWMTNVRPRGLPAVPGLSTFPELNVRTYVRHRGRPGVYFFSLDTTSIPTIAGARAVYALPYFFARMWVDAAEDNISYYCRRVDADRTRPEFHGNAEPDAELIRTPAIFRGRYWAVSDVWHSTPGSLEHFLTERYCLFAVLRKRVYRADIHHVRWPLQTAEARFDENSMALADGVKLGNDKPLLHYARELTVLIWWPERVE